MSQAFDHKLELESQFILRLPQNQANSLRQAIRDGEPLSKRLSVKFDADIRHGTVKLDDTTMPARLFDLPTIIESYKTLDRKNFYKTADISQILICKEDTPLSQDTSADSNNVQTEEEINRAKYDTLFSSIGGVGKREFLFPHGITPPLKNVRRRRFRKTLKKKYVDFREIEKEVKRLLKFDCEAISSRYEIVEELKEKAPPINEDNMPSGLPSAENSQNLDAHALFGDGCSTSEDSDDDDDDDDDDKEDDKEDEIDMDQDNDNDNDDDNMDDDDDLEEVTAAEPSIVPQADIAAEVAAASDLIAQNDDNEEKRQELRRELVKIKERISFQESEMKGLDNQALRMRLQPVLDSLHEQENEIKKQLDELL